MHSAKRCACWTWYANTNVGSKAMQKTRLHPIAACSLHPVSRQAFTGQKNCTD